MTVDDYQQTLSDRTPPAGLSPLLEALWWDGHGDWASSHELAQDVSGKDAAWVHAYLHRKEGDAGNAAYWYRQADRPASRALFEQEWREIVSALL